MQRVEEATRSLRDKARKERAAAFHQHVELWPGMKILDLGSGDGSYFASIIAGFGIKPDDVCSADVDEAALLHGHNAYGFTPTVLDGSGELPFEDGEFDLVFSNSVAEHVTLPVKGDCWETMNPSFRREAKRRQIQFASEIRRVGNGYFVQTPNKWFPIESHSYVPFGGYLPRRVLVPILIATDKLPEWVGFPRTIPDWNLLSRSDLEWMFPDATLIPERWGGIVKSWIAVKTREEL